MSAELLREAAAKLRWTAKAATPGPWERPLNTRYKKSVSAALPEGEQGTWRTGINPETGQRERVGVVSVNTWSDGKHVRKRGGRDLEWIALANPALAGPLADWLEEEVDTAEQVGVPVSESALAVARTILGEVPAGE